MKSYYLLFSLSIAFLECSDLFSQDYPISEDHPLPSTIQQKLLPGEIPEALNCQCPRHLALKGNATNRLGLNPAGVALLDSVPSFVQPLKVIRVAARLSPTASGGAGYQRFYSIIQLKQEALLCGANALAAITQVEQGDSLIFTALAFRVEP